MILQRVPKLWGEELWHHNSGGYCMKTLKLRRGFQCSLHYHPVKAETFLVVQGEVVFELDGELRTLRLGDSIDIPAGHPHRFSARTFRATVIEASTTHDDLDVIRLEESRVL